MVESDWAARSAATKKKKPRYGRIPLAFAGSLGRTSVRDYAEVNSMPYSNKQELDPEAELLLAAPIELGGDGG
jgi:hypothetical protein